WLSIDKCTDNGERFAANELERQSDPRPREWVYSGGQSDWFPACVWDLVRSAVFRDGRYGHHYQLGWFPLLRWHDQRHIFSGDAWRILEHSGRWLCSEAYARRACYQRA